MCYKLHCYKKKQKLSYLFQEVLLRLLINSIQLLEDHHLGRVLGRDLEHLTKESLAQQLPLDQIGSAENSLLGLRLQEGMCSRQVHAPLGVWQTKCRKKLNLLKLQNKTENA